MKELLFDDMAVIKAPSKKRVADKLTPLQLKDFYCDQGKSLDDIGKMFGCSKVYILQLMREYNIPTRNRSEASAQAKRLEKGVRFTQVDEQFFHQRTPQMAYVLGCIYSHGVIGKNSTAFTITHENLELINNIKVYMGSSHRIIRTKRHGLSTLRIGNKNMTLDLLGFGLKPGNGEERVFPMLEDRLYKHFIRGFFDCNGKFAILGNVSRVSFFSTSKLFIEKLQTVINIYAKTNARPIYTYLPPKVYQLSYNSKADQKAIYQFIYDYDTFNSKLYLPKQQILFDKHIQNIFA